jgi:transposase
MMGKKTKQSYLFYHINMKEMIPDNHILILIDKYIDFSFIREKTKHLYSYTGRPSIDPEVLIKMLLVGYIFGITSERKLCEEVNMHMGYRWFVGLNLQDKVPDHSTFSKNRHERFKESGIFQDIFDEIVRRCIDMGLIDGTHISVDGTLVKANASIDSMEPIVIRMNPSVSPAVLKYTTNADQKCTT